MRQPYNPRQRYTNSNLPCVVMRAPGPGEGPFPPVQLRLDTRMSQTIGAKISLLPAVSITLIGPLPDRQDTPSPGPSRSTEGQLSKVMSMMKYLIANQLLRA